MMKHTQSHSWISGGLRLAVLGLDHLTTIDISHNTLSHQRNRYENTITVKSSDPNHQPGPIWQRDAWIRACIQACFRCMSRRAPGELARDCRNLGTLLNSHPGTAMEPEEYVDSVRLRLGCAGPCEPVACQNGSLHTHAAHATCCAVGEVEVPGLLPGTDLRPADVLTSALGNSYTALDISICSPHAQQAGAD